MTCVCRIATRASPLALRQATLVATELTRAHGMRCELVRIRTAGDRMQGRPLASVGGKGLFLKELEQSLLAGETDLAVHSLKDVPAQLPDGLLLGAVCARADARDALVSRADHTLDTLPEGSRVGTASLRRQAQLRALRPDLRLLELRGNVHTRLNRLDSGDVDAVVLACAGLDRLGLAERISERLPATRCLPAIGQGALAIETAVDHAHAGDWIAALHDPDAARCARAERIVAHDLSADCRTPLAAYATLRTATEITLDACLAAPDGTRILRTTAHGAPEAAGRAAAKALREQGGQEILDALGAPEAP